MDTWKTYTNRNSPRQKPGKSENWTDSSYSKRKAEPEHAHINEKWIHNISRYKLSQTERSILAKGLNCTITPNNIPHDEFILATELVCEKIQDQGQKAALRNAIAGILKTAKPPPSNITKQEAKAMRTLAKNKDITILPADKGRTTVIMDTDQYEHKMLELLSDNAYEVLRKDQTEDKKKKTQSTTQTTTQ